MYSCNLCHLVPVLRIAYQFLKTIKYAEDPDYIVKVRQIANML